jgi:hypothetical protein
MTENTVKQGCGKEEAFFVQNFSVKPLFLHPALVNSNSGKT